MLIFGYVTAAVLIAIIIWQLVAFRYNGQVIAWGIAFIASLIAVPLSFYDIAAHVQRLASPLQVHYVRILLMVPIFAIESWLSLRYKEQRIIFEAVRGIYEAFTIQSFFRLMVDYFGGDRKLVAMLAVRGKPEATMLSPLSHFPLSWVFKPWRCDVEGRGAFVENCRIGIAGYVSAQIGVVIINLIAKYTSEAVHYDFFCEGGSSPSCIYPYTSYYLLFWQCVAVYAIVILYHEVQHEIAALRAFPKLMVVKFVVFVSFWQSIVRVVASTRRAAHPCPARARATHSRLDARLIATRSARAAHSHSHTPRAPCQLIFGLGYFGYIKGAYDYDKHEMSVAIQDFTICIEMAIAALFHRENA